MTTITAGHSSRELLAPGRARQVRRSIHDGRSGAGRSPGIRVAVRMLAITLIVICALALDHHAITMPDVSVANLGTSASALLDAARAAVADGSTTVSDATVNGAAVSDAAVFDARVSDAAVSDAAVSDAAVSDAPTDAAALDDAGPSPHELARCWRQAHRLGLDPAGCASANG